MQAILDYSLNRFCPLIIIAFIVFSKFGIEAWEPWLVVGLVLFVERFHFKSGYAVAFCEERGIPTE
jgi:hypothetical protein